MIKISKVLGLLFGLGMAATLAGCTTVKSVPHTFGPEAEGTASMSFKAKAASVVLVYYDKTVLPQPEKNTCRDPISFPAGKELPMTVHAHYEQESNNSNLITLLATAAIAQSRKVDTDVDVICPPLEKGKAYDMEFRKSAGVTGKNKIVIIDVLPKKIIYEQVFSSK